MISELTNHVWQSTVFAALAGLLTMAFRHNRAQVRYWLWLSASCKFLLPFSLLMMVGNRIEWAPATQTVAAPPAVALAIAQMSEPFPSPKARAPATRGGGDWVAGAMFGTWVCGFVTIALIRWRGWRRIRAAVRAGTPAELQLGVEVRSSPGLLEPGVVGVFRPVLLLPAGIADRLTPPQLEAVLAHELCHIRRRDNLSSAIHMAVEAVFWFHPFVWWIGARLVEERERACDEAVLSLGNEPSDYAQGILNVCKNYVESPLFCVSGVTGSDLKKRLQEILTGRVPGSLNFLQKLILAAAGTAAIIAPMVAGLIDAPAIAAPPPTVTAPKFETASITPCEAFRTRPVPESPGKLQTGCTTLRQFIEQAYGPFASGHMNPLSSVTISGGPAWTGSDYYEIDAKAAGHPSQGRMKGPMLRALLEDRFHLRVHQEAKEVPVYQLTLAGGGPKLQPFQGTCTLWDADEPAHRDPIQMCGRVVNLTKDGFDFNAATMVDLCYFLFVTLERPLVDKTGISGRFDFHMEVPTGDLRRQARGLPGFGNPAAPPPALGPSFLAAIRTTLNTLGLALGSSNGPGKFVVIERVERPSAN